ncbi:eCIS core domain-containing protein [Streptomyces sp. NPDC002446]
MSTARSSTQDTRSAAEAKRRKRRERAATSRTPEPKDIVSGAGQPLDVGVRRELEEQLGHDFSRVRLHTDRDSGQLAELMGADAFAVGQDIFFREGAFRPGTADGQRLLAHELLHTVQNPHGLGALRAGRDLGSVSLPQEAVEREAESAAQETVRAALAGSVRAEAPGAEIEPGQATPGWLRYATVDADRRRFELLDPATLVDRLAHGVLRSLRGDPEDLSGRVRLQLARLAPEVQERVLDRLEARLPTPALERLYELVEEAEQAGALPLDAAAAPEAVPDEAETLRQERAQRAAAERSERAQAEKEGDDRRTRERQRKDSDPAGDGGAVERGGPSRSAAGGPSKAAAPQTAAAESGQPVHGTGETAGEQQESRAQEKQQDTGAARQRSQKDAAGAAGGQEEDRQDAGRQPEQAAEHGAEGGGDERADQAAEERGAGPEDLDRSAEEPGEKDRTGRGVGGDRRAGDPRNEEDADDEPLGLQEESADLDEDAGDDGTEDGDEDDALDAADDETDDGADGEAAGDTGDSLPEDGLDGSARAAANGTHAQNTAGGGRDGAPGVRTSPADEDRAADLRQAESEAGGAGAGAAPPENASGDRLSADLQTGTSVEQEIGPEPEESADDRTGEEPGENLTDPADADDAEREREQAAERREDAEAKRRDEAARAATAGSGGAGFGGGAGATGQLAKSDEDARRQAVSTASASSATGAGDGKSAAGGPGGAADAGVQAARTGEASGADTGTASGAPGGPAADRAAGTARGSSAPGGSASGGSASGGAVPAAGEQPKDDLATKDATEGKGATEAKDAPATQDVTEGKGPATTPGSPAGPDTVSAAGSSLAPKLLSGSGSAGAGSAGAPAAGGAPAAAGAPRSAAAKPAVRPNVAGPKRQAARQAAKAAGRRGGGGGGTSARSAPAPAPARGGGGGGGRGAASGATKPKKEAPAPDVSKGTPESGLATAAGLKPHIALETLKGVDGAVGHSVGKERAALRKAPPKTERPSGSPKTVPGGPKAAAPGTYTNAKVSRTEAAQGRTPEIDGEQRPEGEPPTADMPEPSWWDIGVTIGAKLLGKLLKELLPLDDLIDSILELPTADEGMQGTRVGDAPGLPLQDDSDPQRTDEQGQKLDERKNELHRSGREDAARPMGEDQIYPDVPRETLTGKVLGGKGRKAGTAGGRKAPAGGIPVESASAVAEHDRGPQIQAGFGSGRQKMTDERRAKDRKARDDRQKHDRDLKREVDASGKAQAGEREKGQSEISGHRDKWRKEQDDKVAEIDGKKGKRYDEVRGKIKKREKETDDHVEERTKKDNEQIKSHHTGAKEKAEQKKKDSKDNADNWLDGAINELKSWFKEIKNAIKGFFEEARKAVTGLIDKFKTEVFKFIDKARNWVVDRINEFADGLIALGDELLADYPAMRDKWRNTINGARNYAVRKVNEAAGALKKVVGGLLDGLSDALVAGLNVLEDGLMKAVDIAEGAVVGALEFAKGVIEALGEWAAIFHDIVSDPGGWISKAGDAARTGAREYLFEETKAAVKKWINDKIQEITGLSPEDFQALIEGNVTAEEMGKMAWEAALPQLPLIIGELVVKQVVAKLIPGAGWAMAVIDALKTAWGALSEILAAFGLFMDFLKAVKSGNAARPFAKAVAAGVVALLELIYQALVHGIQKYMGKVTGKLGEMLKNIRSKRKPGGQDGPDGPGAPGRPGHHDRPGGDGRPGSADRPGPTADKPGPTDKPNQRPVPRKPSPDKASRPQEGPRLTKRPSPEKKPRPEHRPQPKSKKKPDEHERREDGREVNAARRRARDAQRKQHDDDKPRLTKRRGPARDTLRKNRPDRKRDDDRTQDPLRKKKQDAKKPDLRKNKPTAKKPRRRPDSRTRRTLRRARQTIKSALNRARRAARRLFGKGRKLTRKLNNRAHRLRQQWRRRRDRIRRNRERRRDRARRERQNEVEIKRPTVPFRDETGEFHTLQFDGGQNQDLSIHSTPKEVPPFIADWTSDIKKQIREQGTTAELSEQLEHIRLIERWHRVAESMEERIPKRTPKNSVKNWKPARKRLRSAMDAVARHAKERRYYGLPKYLEPQNYKDARADRIKGQFIQESTKTVFGGPGQIAKDASPGMPPGWSYIEDKTLGTGSAWVRMHLLPERMGGLAKGNNLVPARGPETNGEFFREIENPAYQAIPKKNRIIWYEATVKFGHPPHPEPEFADFPKHIHAAYGGYKKIKGTGEERSDWEELTTPIDQHSDPVEPPGQDEGGTLAINTTGHVNIERLLKVKRSLADHLIAARDLHGGFDDVDDVRDGMNEYRKTLTGPNALPVAKLNAMISELAALQIAKKVNWKKKGAQ